MTQKPFKRSTEEKMNQLQHTLLLTVIFTMLGTSSAATFFRQRRQVPNWVHLPQPCPTCQDTTETRPYQLGIGAAPARAEVYGVRPAFQTQEPFPPAAQYGHFNRPDLFPNKPFFPPHQQDPNLGRPYLNQPQFLPVLNNPQGFLNIPVNQQLLQHHLQSNAQSQVTQQFRLNGANQHLAAEPGNQFQSEINFPQQSIEQQPQQQIPYQQLQQQPLIQVNPQQLFYLPSAPNGNVALPADRGNVQLVYLPVEALPQQQALPVPGIIPPEAAIPNNGPPQELHLPPPGVPQRPDSGYTEGPMLEMAVKEPNQEAFPEIMPNNTQPLPPLNEEVVVTPPPRKTATTNLEGDPSTENPSKTEKPSLTAAIFVNNDHISNINGHARNITFDILKSTDCFKSAEAVSRAVNGEQVDKPL